jgi:hypothetical protein
MSPCRSLICWGVSLSAVAAWKSSLQNSDSKHPQTFWRANGSSLEK